MVGQGRHPPRAPTRPVVDGLLIGRRVNKQVDAKFPANTESGWKLGFYAASRASQLRRMRAPRPQVKRGDKID